MWGVMVYYTESLLLPIINQEHTKNLIFEKNKLKQTKKDNNFYLFEVKKSAESTSFL